MNKFLSVSRLGRRLSDGSTEALTFVPGVNVLVGAPNTGKTKWLQTLDYLLGDPGENPFDDEDENRLVHKYDAASADLVVGSEFVRIERTWREPGTKTKVFVNGKGMSGREFQEWLLRELGIPLLHFPKGNPMSGQTWPELSFRMLLRHIYRRQRFWGGIADQQPDAEQHACLLQFLGLAEYVFTNSYGQLVQLRREAEQLKARRDQYSQTLEDVAREVLSGPDRTVGVSSATIEAAEQRLRDEVQALYARRAALLIDAQGRVLPSQKLSRIMELSEAHARGD